MDLFCQYGFAATIKPLKMAALLQKTQTSRPLCGIVMVGSGIGRLAGDGKLNLIKMHDKAQHVLRHYSFNNRKHVVAKHCENRLSWRMYITSNSWRNKGHTLSGSVSWYH